MTAILLCGEGPHDMGEEGVWCERTKSYISVEGWLQILTRKFLQGQTVSFELSERAALMRMPRGKDLQPFPSGHGLGAMLAKLAAISSGFEAVIYMADADTDKVSTWRSMRREIQDGFNRPLANLVTIACLPLSASESWLLADKNAWQLSGLSPQDCLKLPKKPEEIWGLKSDPNGNRPHRYFARICKLAKLADDRETRTIIADASDIKCIELSISVE